MSKKVFTWIKFSTEVCHNIMDWINSLKFKDMDIWTYVKETVFVFAGSQDGLFSSNDTNNYSYQQINTCYMDSWWEEHFSLKYEHSRSN